MRLRLASLALVCATLDLALAARRGEEVGFRALAARCESSFTVSAPLPARTPPAGLRLQVCRGDACDDYDLAGRPLAFTASTVCQGECYLQDGVVQVSRVYDDPAALATGETYDVRLFDPATERTYAEAHGPMLYTTVPATRDEAAADGSAICRLGEVSARPVGGS